MRLFANVNSWLLACVLAVSAAAMAAGTVEKKWTISAPVLSQGPGGSFDEVAVKDPSIVFFEGKWHLFYTARSKNEYTTGYVSAKKLEGLKSAPRHQLKTIRGTGRYGCAPQILYYRPQRKWYLIFQNRDSNYQPAFSTTTTISRPETWSEAKPLIRKDARAKWIDFWIIRDKTKAYLFYTQAHGSVIVRTTGIDKFPGGWGAGREVLKGVHEAVHIYKVKDRREFHMIYELNKGGIRSFALAVSGDLEGPWKKVTDKYATGDRLETASGAKTWTEMVSHGELIRSGYDERMEYDPKGCRWIIQGILKKDSKAPYPSLPWRLGIMSEAAGIKP